MNFFHKNILKKKNNNNCGEFVAPRMDIGSNGFNLFFFLHYMPNKHNIYYKFIVYLLHEFIFMRKSTDFKVLKIMEFDRVRVYNIFNETENIGFMTRQFLFP